jgi:lipopolysaccharide export system protein LptA
MMGARRILCAVLLWSLIGMLPESLSAQQKLAVEVFRITQNSLEHLKREGLPDSVLVNLATLLGQEYASEELFREILLQLPVPPEEEDLELVFRYSGQERLKIESEEFLSNLTDGEAIFRGNVRGRVTRENLEFGMAKLRMLRQEGLERLIGEGGVRFRQWDRVGRMDYVTYERARETEVTPEVRTARMEGNVLLEAEQGRLSAHLISADLTRQRAVIEGQSAAQKRLRLDMQLHLLDTTAESATQATPRTLSLQAYRAELDAERGQAILEGDVEMERLPEGVYVRSGRIEIRLNAQQQITSAKAERGVCIEQPGRLARAGIAYFDDVAQTIRLEQDAEVYSGNYILKGNSISLFLDVNRGVAQGDETSPIEVTIAMENQPQPFQCR